MGNCRPYVEVSNFYEFLGARALTEQNNVVHQHLENVSSQAAHIRQAANSLVGTPNEDETADSAEYLNFTP
jgi:hypothetical protein